MLLTSQRCCIYSEGERETNYKDRSPKVVMVDFSAAMISAVLTEYNSMSREKYMNTLYKAIVQTNQKTYDMTIVLVCLVQLMKTNGRCLDQLAKNKAPAKDYGSIRHLAMRVNGLIANTENLQKIERIQCQLLIVLKTEFVDNQLKDALNFLKDSINTFQFSLEITSDCSEEAEGSLNYCMDDEQSLSVQTSN